MVLKLFFECFVEGVKKEPQAEPNVLTYIRTSSTDEIKQGSKVVFKDTAKYFAGGYKTKFTVPAGQEGVVSEVVTVGCTYWVKWGAKFKVIRRAQKL